MITKGDLVTPEQGQTVTTRKRPAVEDAVAELAALRARIQAARTIEPAPKDRHCLDCFNRGRNAAIRAIEGDQ